MIAYRAETAMVAMLRQHLNKEDEARALVRALFVSSADIEPNEQANTLTINIHRMATPAHDKALGLLLPIAVVPKPAPAVLVTLIAVTASSVLSVNVTLASPATLTVVAPLATSDATVDDSAVLGD